MKLKSWRVVPSTMADLLWGVRGAFVVGGDSLITAIELLPNGAGVVITHRDGRRGVQIGPGFGEVDESAAKAKATAAKAVTS